MMMKCKRVTTHDELMQAAKVREEVFVKEQGVPSELEIDEYDISPDACYHFIVVEEGQAIAAGRFKRFEEEAAKMQRIAVLKPYRGMGVGKLLLQKMEEEAKADGFKASVLDAQCSAEVFYSKLGYLVESEEPFLDADIWHVRMRKSL
ncbi:GNAT family N-acetyltransferase [Cohnella abietis]|nr:GNAT family N-acetyltransferase [Cohnella abietis]